MLKSKVASMLTARAAQAAFIVGSFAGISTVTTPVHAIGDPCTVARIKCYNWYKDDPAAYAACIEEVENGICDTSGGINPPPLPPNCGNLNEWPCEIQYGSPRRVIDVEPGATSGHALGSCAPQMAADYKRHTEALAVERNTVMMRYPMETDPLDIADDLDAIIPDLGTHGQV